jgi:uncharacterized membrane protein
MNRTTGILAIAMALGAAATTSLAQPHRSYPRFYNLGYYILPSAVSADGSAVVGAPAFWWTESGGTVIASPPWQSSCYATAITADTIRVFGYCNQPPDTSFSFRWVPGTPVEFLIPTIRASAASADGQVVVGGDMMFSSAYRWTSTTGLQNLGLAPGFGGAWPRAICADGHIITGNSWWWWKDANFGFRWTAQTGMQQLPLPTWATRCGGFAISADGAFIGGACSSPSALRPVRWSAQLHPEELVLPPGWSVGIVAALNHDGSIAAGDARFAELWRAVLWTSGGMIDLTTHLASQGVNMEGWLLSEARAISADGRVVAGTGSYHGQHHGWVAILSPGCYANCDASTTPPILNIEDFTCFISDFAAASQLPHNQQLNHYANCDHSNTAPVLNVEDFACFINKFAAGCD